MHRAKGVFMLNRRGVIIAVAALAVSFSGGAFRLHAQEPVSLTGHIKSDDEGLMEGVAVSARRAGSNMTLTVISNEKGVYAFPQNRLEANQYSITVRAVGYDLASPVTVAVSPQSPATLDLQLRKLPDISSQHTNAEWLMSVPGTQQQRSEEHTSELQSQSNLVCRLLLEKKITRHLPTRNSLY